MLEAHPFSKNGSMIGAINVVAGPASESLPEKGNQLLGLPVIFRFDFFL